MEKIRVVEKTQKDIAILVQVLSTKQGIAAASNTRTHCWKQETKRWQIWNLQKKIHYLWPKNFLICSNFSQGNSEFGHNRSWEYQLKIYLNHWQKSYRWIYRNWNLWKSLQRKQIWNNLTKKGTAQWTKLPLCAGSRKSRTTLGLLYAALPCIFLQEAVSTTQTPDLQVTWQQLYCCTNALSLFGII